MNPEGGDRFPSKDKEVDFFKAKDMDRRYMTEKQFEKLKREQMQARYMDSRKIADVFPDIERIEISYKLHHDSAFGSQHRENTWTINPQDRMCFILECLNRECSSAGFDLKNEIYSMRRDHLTEKSGEMRCDGQEAPDHPEQSCECSLKYTIKVLYK